MAGALGAGWCEENRQRRDVWCKHTRQPFINHMYERSKIAKGKAGNYHNDDGIGATITAPARIAAAAARLSGRPTKCGPASVTRRGS